MKCLFIEIEIKFRKICFDSAVILTSHLVRKQVDQGNMQNLDDDDSLKVVNWK